MIKLLGYLLLCILMGCAKKENELSAKVQITTPKARMNQEMPTDTLWICCQSRVFWKGTKMRGLGKHEGKLYFETGYLTMSGSQPLNGYLTVNMKSIQVTDIPESDPIPLQELTDHLKDADFFDVDNYPKAHFELVNFIPLGQDRWGIDGNLVIKGISNAIYLEAIRDANGWSTRFRINRFDWDIAYRGSWADRTLVDKEIELQVDLVTKQ